MALCISRHVASRLSVYKIWYHSNSSCLQDCQFPQFFRTPYGW